MCTEYNARFRGLQQVRNRMQGRGITVVHFYFKADMFQRSAASEESLSIASFSHCGKQVPCATLFSCV